MKRNLGIAGLGLVVVACLIGLIAIVTGRIQIAEGGVHVISSEPQHISSSEAITDGTGGAGESAGKSTNLDLEGRVIEPEDVQDVPSASEIRQMKIGNHGRFQVPAKGMDVPLLSMNAVNGRVTPPGYRSAYLLRGFGKGIDDPKNNTVIVTMHSAMHGFPPGDYLVSKQNGNSKLAKGTEIYVDGIVYRVTGSESVSKKALPKTTRVWNNQKGRLVIITCRQIGGPKTTENTIIYADLVQGQDESNWYKSDRS